jgi:starch-binding outer membrane protein, SusD/RagB family
MKTNYSIFITCALLLFFLLSCDKDWLDRRPYGSVTRETLTSDIEGVNLILIGAYSVLKGDNPYNNPHFSAPSNWIFGSIPGGDAYKGTEPADQSIEIDEIERYTTQKYNQGILSKWNTLYDGIRRANDAILAFQTINDKGLSPELKKTRIAEAIFLRAYFHFEAKKLWNNIPYINEKVIDFRVPNDHNIWPDIVKDFQSAIQDLPASQKETGRITKGAAIAMLGKSYLYQQKYPEAKAAFEQVIGSGNYQLTATYHENFNVETRDNKETLLTVQFSKDGKDGENGNTGDVLNFPFNQGPVGCCGFHQPSQNLVNAFKTDDHGLPLLDDFNKTDIKNDQGIPFDEPFVPGTENVDPRLDWTVGRRGIPYLDWGLHAGSSWIRDQAYGGPYSPIKNVHHKSQESVYVGTAWGGFTGFNTTSLSLIRYADVLLMAAECEVETGNLEKAREYVNLIRQRAKNPEGFVKKDDGTPAANYKIELYLTPWTDKSYAMKAVRFERRIELGMEGHRFFDLVRWKIASAEINNYLTTESEKRGLLKGAKFIEGKHEYYPIPDKAITTSYLNNKPTLIQNPNY